MSRISSLLQERFKQDPISHKMAELVQKSSEGSLNSFEGIFASSQLSDQERDELKAILDQYQSDATTPNQDLVKLCSLTVEIKAITKQAILLHGERIKHAQQLFKTYKEGAFSAWLIHAYGNRQTPYNLLLFYEFFNQLPSLIRPKLELLPRQAVYTLASRKGTLNSKIEIIENYQGESKNHLLEVIRKRFPLNEKDARRGDHPALLHLRQALSLLNKAGQEPLSPEQKQQGIQIIKTCQRLLQSQ